MISIFFGCLIVSCYMNNQALASLISCPTKTSEPTSIRYTITFSISGETSYTGTLLLSSNENFVSFLTESDSENPQKAIQGTWSLSDCGNILTLNANTFYFLDLPTYSINGLTCTYTCGLNTSTRRTCTIAYTTKSLKASGTFAIPIDLSLPA